MSGYVERRVTSNFSFLRAPRIPRTGGGSGRACGQ